jgi:hypothetical protein
MAPGPARGRGRWPTADAAGVGCADKRAPNPARSYAQAQNQSRKAQYRESAGSPDTAEAGSYVRDKFGG